MVVTVQASRSMVLGWDCGIYLQHCRALRFWILGLGGLVEGSREVGCKVHMGLKHSRWA